MEKINKFLGNLSDEIRYLEKVRADKMKKDIYWRTEDTLIKSYKRLLK